MRRAVKAVFGAAGLCAVIVLGCMGYAGALQLAGNFHEVSGGKVFRAAQMDGRDLGQWVRAHGLKSVVNLRGAHPGEAWYDAERAAADRLGITHIDFAMSAQDELTDAEVQALLVLLRDAPKPLLIHCKSGSDRTGIASALYLAGIEGRSEAEAEHQLSFRFGHVGLPWVSKAWAMDATWERIEPWLGYSQS